MTVQGVASANAATATMPAHQAGDLILIFVRRSSDIPATTPPPTFAVPNWTILQSAGGGAMSLVSAWALATASNHTTGSWTGATHVCVIVLRADSDKELGIGPSSTGNQTLTETIVYPALTLSTIGGTSWGVRCGARNQVDTEVANAPAGWTNQIVQPAGASALMAVHTLASLAANPTADTVSTTGINSPYHAHTIEVTEQPGVTARVVGTAYAATDNVAMPAHQAGDLIVVFARVITNTPPTPPTAGGTIPAWTVAQSGGANVLSLVSAWAVATAANHTTGNWTVANNICVLILRPGIGKALGVGPSSSANEASTQTVVYPALTLSKTDGTSFGVRCGERNNAGADLELNVPPSGWTALIVQASGLIAVHSRAALTSNPIADTVATIGTNAPYRAHTLEVTEAAPIAQQPLVSIV